MKKIGVLADTHSVAIPDKVMEAIKDVDFIIHAGDFTEPADLKVLTEGKEVKAVFGNMDEAPLTKELPEKEIFEVEDVRIGVTHGFGPRKKVADFVFQAFHDTPVDVIVFGHTHEAMNEKWGDILMFNPGSTSDYLTSPMRSFGILEIDGKEVRGKIIEIQD